MGDDNPFNDIAAAAAKKIDDRTAAQQAALVPSWDSVKAMLPDPLDQKKLDDLQAIVKSSADHNAQVASLTNNIASLAPVVLKALTLLG
jgi:hypothetical protein